MSTRTLKVNLRLRIGGYSFTLRQVNRSLHYTIYAYDLRECLFTPSTKTKWSGSIQVLATAIDNTFQLWGNACKSIEAGMWR